MLLSMVSFLLCVLGGFLQTFISINLFTVSNGFLVPHAFSGRLGTCQFHVKNIKTIKTDPKNEGTDGKNRKQHEQNAQFSVRGDGRVARET